MLFTIDGDTGFDHLLGVIPSATGVGLKNCHQNTDDSYSGQQSTQCQWTKQEPNQNRSQDSQQTGSNHLTKRRLRGDLDTLAVLCGSMRFIKDSYVLFRPLLLVNTVILSHDGVSCLPSRAISDLSPIHFHHRCSGSSSSFR